MAVKSIQLNTIGRVLLIVAGVFCVLAAYFITRWGLGHTIAQYTNVKDAAESAIEYAPYDPQPHLTLAGLNEKSFLAEDLPAALQEYEKAAAIAPNDYRVWLTLGKARERAGDRQGAEKALRRALELAPNYSGVHWALGNNLLRQGITDEAFVEIRKAVENDPTYSNPAVYTAWQTFDGDVAQISQKIGDSLPIKAGLAPFLAKQQKFDEAFAFWNSVPDNEKASTYKTNGEELIKSLTEAKKYRDALKVQSQINETAADEKFTVGAIFNSDFEKTVKRSGAGTFDWQIAAGEQPQISLDGSQKHGGNQSLIIFFNSSTGQEFRPVSQLVAVESGKTYKFEAFYRSDLKTMATVRWEITDATDGKVLATTAPTTDKTDWTALAAEFTTLPTTQAVNIKLVRADCKQPLCPISGKLWFDDLSLK